MHLAAFWGALGTCDHELRLQGLDSPWPWEDPQFQTLTITTAGGAAAGSSCGKRINNANVGAACVTRTIFAPRCDHPGCRRRCFRHCHWHRGRFRCWCGLGPSAGVLFGVSVWKRTVAPTCSDQAGELSSFGLALFPLAWRCESLPGPRTADFRPVHPSWRSCWCHRLDSAPWL